MDKQSLHETAKRLALELPFVELCWPFGPEFDVFKIGGKIFMLSSELRGVPFINLKSDPQKSLLNQQIYPSIKPGVVFVNVSTAAGSSLKTTNDVMMRIEKRMMDIPQVLHVQRVAGYGLLAGQGIATAIC